MSEPDPTPPSRTVVDDTAAPHPLLAELCDEQRRRWRQGDRAPVEAYLDRAPALGSNRDAVLDLIYNEVLLREEAGERPRLEEYQQRFPQLGEPLRLQFEVDRALERGGLADSAPPPAHDSESEPPLPQVPGYELLEVLGRGGMGVVYKARHLSLNRLVALKMILAGAHAGRQELARFHTEAQAVARLHHPHIVQVYEIGAHDGRPFMALELVEGNLTNSLAGTPVPPRQAAQWLEPLARAVHHAHQLGIVHRDLKPANILLSRKSEIRSSKSERADSDFGPQDAEVVLKITDFGMAKMAATAAPGQTHSGAILGTPSYMAPEQAAGKTREVGPATDVYGLGAILYEMLTGRPPFRGADVPQTLDLVRLQDPVPPSRLRPKLPRDLETICLACLQKEPRNRYATAQALADDLNAFLAGEPIRSRPVRPAERLARWARRRPAEAVLVAAGGMAVLGLGVGLVWSHALAAGAVAGLSLLAGSGWYSARLQRALGELTRQQLLQERSVERLQLLLEMTRRLVRTTDPHHLLRLLAETTARLTHAELATIFLLDHERGELWSTVTLDQGVGEIRVPIGVGIAGTVARTGAPVNLPDAYADPRFNPEIDRRTGHKTRTLLTVPMTAPDGTVLGVFQVINKREGTFGVDDIEILAALAASAAVAVERRAT